MSEENKQIDSLQPSWAAHELFALALTLVLAIWIVSQYGKEARPQSLTTDRDEARAAKRAELKKADEEALGSYGVVDEARKVYRIPVTDAMSVVVSRMQEDSTGLHGDLVARSQAAAGLAVVVPAEDGCDQGGGHVEVCALQKSAAAGYTFTSQPN